MTELDQWLIDLSEWRTAPKASRGPRPSSPSIRKRRKRERKTESFPGQIPSLLQSQFQSQQQSQLTGAFGTQQTGLMGFQYQQENPFGGLLSGLSCQPKWPRTMYGGY